MCPTTARSLESPYHIDGDNFERAYKDHLSGFRTWKHAAHAEHWLVFPRNMRPRVCIDEVALSDGELYTIVSNPDAHGKRGSIIAIVKGTKVEDVVESINHIFLYEREKVREVTMDFSESMRSIVKQCFPYAEIVVDRFHMQKLCCDAMQECRIAAKREAVKQENKDRKEFKQRKKQLAKHHKQGKKGKRGRKLKRKNEAYRPFRFDNGDTRPELLARSRYLLMTSAEKWTESQKARAEILFSEYPDIEKAYSITHSLRTRFNKLYSWIEAKVSIENWYGMVDEFNNEAFNTVKDTIENREGEVLNYFINRSTNAFAESLNAKIKHFRAQLRGVADVPFFLFRLSNIFG